MEREVDQLVWKLYGLRAEEIAVVGGGKIKFGELCAGQEKERTSADVVGLGGVCGGRTGGARNNGCIPEKKTAPAGREG